MVKKSTPNQNQNNGPSKKSKVDSGQMEWHTVTSDDEEAYVNEMKSLTKD